MNILSKGVIADTSEKTIKTNTNSNMRSGGGGDVMPRPRDPRRDKAFRLWEESGRSKKLKDIAEQLNVTSSTVRKWKANDKWEEKIKGSALLRRGAPKGNKNAKGNKGGRAPLGNKNALGNKGGAAPLRNQNAVTHGFFSKFLPKDTLSIMEEIKDRSPVDMICNQIQIQYVAIIRAQKIKFVSDKQEMIKELKKKLCYLRQTKSKRKSMNSNFLGVVMQRS